METYLPSCLLKPTPQAGGEARRARHRDQANGDRGGVAGVHGGAGGNRGQQRVHASGGARHAPRVRISTDFCACCCFLLRWGLGEQFVLLALICLYSCMCGGYVIRVRFRGGMFCVCCVSCALVSFGACRRMLRKNKNKNKTGFQLENATKVSKMPSPIGIGYACKHNRLFTYVLEEVCVGVHLATRVQRPREARDASRVRHGTPEVGSVVFCACCCCVLLLSWPCLAVFVLLEVVVGRL